MASVFTKIIAGEIPCYKVAENADYLAFLDISPLNPGHTLVIPKVEVDKLFDLEVSVYNGLMAFSRKVGLAIEQSMPCNRVSMMVVGLEVPHAHVHLVPINEMNDASFQKERVVLNAEQMQDIAKKIASNF